MKSRLFRGFLLAILLLTTTGPAHPTPAPASTEPPMTGASSSVAAVTSATVDDLYLRVKKRLDQWIDERDWSRYHDGYVYSVDIGQLLAFAARIGDQRIYNILREYAIANFILNEPADPFTQGMALWRYKPGAPPDATGTTEPLRLAQGLWIGSKTFGDPTDRDLAIKLVKGYVRHQYVDQGFWIIRNYFNVQTRAFATNSFLIDYDADFIAEVAEETGDPEFRDVAERSYEWVRRAATRTGLLNQVIQPEIWTVYGDDSLVIFSPNDVAPVDDSCQEAERSFGQVPEAAQRILTFAFERPLPLRQFYLTRTGEVATERKAEVKAFSCLIRLAIKLKHEEARKLYLELLVQHAELWMTYENPWLKMSAISELIESLRVIKASMGTPAPPPVPAPALLTPADAHIASDMSPLLTWTNPPGTTQVHLQVAPYSNDGPGINLIRAAQTSYQVTGPEFGVGNYVLLPGMTYIWRVRSTTSANPLGAGDPGWSGWTARTFKTPVVTSTTISPASPAHGATVASLTPTVRWDNANRRVFYYEFQLSKDLKFGSGPAGGTAMVYSALVHGAAADPPNSYNVPAAFPLEPKTSYFWRVRPRVQGDASPVAWSNVWSFYVE